MISGKCPHCGGEVKDGICPYCDSDLRDEREKDKENLYGMVINARLDREAAAKKQKKQKTAAVIVSVCFGVFVLGVFVFNPLTRLLFNGSRYNAANIAARAKSSVYDTDKNSSASPSENDIEEEVVDKNELYRQKGRWTPGTYKVGTDIPFGTYIMTEYGSSDNSYPIGFYPTPECRDEDNMSAQTWYHGQSYISLNDEGYLELSWCILLSIDKNDLKNDPYTNGGMFLVGRDIEAGTYELVSSRKTDSPLNGHLMGSYAVYSDVDVIAPVIKKQGEFEEGLTVTLSDGEFLKLVDCVIKK